MGCDIHMHVEVKKKDTWETGDYFKKNKAKEYVRLELHGNRNYRLFSVLANVRNSNKNNYICKPKGIPNDVSKEVYDDFKGWSIDAHSASYLNLKELKDFSAKSDYLEKESGMISVQQAKQLDKENILPGNWCEWFSDQTLVFREWVRKIDVLKPLITKLQERKEEYFYSWDDIDDENIRIVFWFDN